MRKYLGEFIFWGILAGIAIFYILVGNDMYQDKYDLIALKEKALLEKRAEETKAKELLETNTTK
jgi:hypothetical protein